MRHLDEHTLELYLLGSPDLQLSRGEIERHLSKCKGCRDLYDEILLFYRRTENIYERSATEPLAQDEVLVPQTRHHHLDRRLPVTLASHPPARTLQRVFSFARLHPIASGAASLTLALAVFGAITLTTGHLKDSNPAYYHLNPAQGKVEIFNKENEELWAIPAKRAEEAARGEIINRYEAVKVVDLDMDGKNEVVTTLSGVGSDPADVVSLCIFTSEGHVKKRNTFGRTVWFRGREYIDTHLGIGIVIGESVSNGQKEILCRAFTGRSPSAILRYDGNGELLGEYWHYGHITCFTMVDVHS